MSNENLPPGVTQNDIDDAYGYLDEEPEFQEDQPAPGDYTLTPVGPLGSLIGVAQIEGKYLGDFKTEEDAFAFICDHSDRENFWPNIWWVSDHGNWTLITEKL